MIRKTKSILNPETLEMAEQKMACEIPELPGLSTEKNK